MTDHLGMSFLRKIFDNTQGTHVSGWRSFVRCRRFPSFRRMHLAETRAVRALEFRVWLAKCKSKRATMHVLVNSVIYLTILCLTYTNLVFAARFDR